MLGVPLRAKVPPTPPDTFTVLDTDPPVRLKLCAVPGMPVYDTGTTLLALLEYQ